ncbi:MAG: PH domain-containing protein [Microbacteriaceae bacterium]|nr:PH domain-containing protein [Microbacteriaceae bacterium]
MTLPERDPEAVVAELRPSVGMLVLPALLLVGAVGAFAFFGLRVAEPWQRWALAGGAGVVVVFGFVLPLWFWASRRYTVTTRRTVLRDGMVVRRRREILHARVIEVATRVNPAQSFSGSGDVVLELGGGHTAVLRSVPQPRLVQAALTDLVGDQRADREFRRRSSGEQPRA